ncbi:toxin-antitoxin system YwqK family antitoxin [Vibrio mangrovi]|uniref:Putative antitoxin YwqK n=1 Tax=Vibrio mangrovi TaxID=474394 RepID=A0A1Y6IYQ4_9VIBR|nr:hypothetical protein [Vibrio mangrovi]MDW6002326.1 hypothetical protein [Vibrio mangrovi]SMS02777.1 Putative antitoxin YwqK [Vibrio mangrovi]
MIRIDDDELDLDGDLCLYEGHPFTGVSYEPGTEGKLLSEVEYKNGFATGITKRWYPSGQLKEEFSCKRGLRHGESTTWFDNGCIKIKAEYELGIELGYQEWNESGDLVESRELDPESVQANLLKRHREMYADW